MKNEMKNEMNENSDDLAAIGIGAMIVFIALILVAAVAAAVIIQTAEKLQQNAQATGDDTQEQMSTKVILLSTVIESTTGGAESLFSTFELGPGSEPIDGDGIGYVVVCDTGGANAIYADGTFLGATVHTGDGAGGAAITLLPGTTYVISLDITGCVPTANENHILIISVNGGGNTYEELQYGSSPSVGDVVV
jgi:flagellin FlaB